MANCKEVTELKYSKEGGYQASHKSLQVC